MSNSGMVTREAVPAYNKLKRTCKFGVLRLVHISGDSVSFFRLHELEAQREQLLTSLSEISAQRDNFLKTITELIQQRDAAYVTIQALDGQRSQFGATYEELSAQYANLKSQYDTLTGHYQELSGQHETLLGHYHKLSGHYEKLCGQYDTLSGQYGRLKGHYDKLSTDFDQLAAQRDALRKEFDEVALQRENLIRQVADLSLQSSDRKEGKPRNSAVSGEDSRNLYLDLMEKTLIGLVYNDPPMSQHNKREFNAEDRFRGLDWPANAFSMIGEARMRNVRSVTERVLADKIPGDIVETGVWRGGASIMAKAVLQAYGDRGRRVFLADSFEGLPPPNVASFPADEGSTFHEYKELAVSEDQVKENFKRLGLLDERVITVKGWFRDTMPTFPVKQIALLRLDGDMYESTIDPLNALYDKISKNGWIIIDDYQWIAACKQAVQDFLNSRNLKPDIRHIDGVGVFFQKT